MVARPSSPSALIDRTLYILTGCTGVGKTDWALQWAERYGGEIVSCDSLLVYRGMDIGTAKPTVRDRARVRHHLIDVAAVSEAFDVARYVGLAREAIAGIHGRGGRVLVAGGSGFYLKAFFAPVADRVHVPPDVRRRAEALLANRGLEAAVEELRRINPEGLGVLDRQNPRRVVRALERCWASGRTLAELDEAFRSERAPFADYPVRLCRLERDRAELDERLEKRVERMLADGLVEEVRRLEAAGLRSSPSAASAIGYREVLACLDGKLPTCELAAEIVRNTRRLAKKQRTWFRTQLPEHRVVMAGERPRVEELFPMKE